MAVTVTKPVCYLLFRLLLPLTLLAAAVFRFNALSFLYAVFLLISPLLSVPNPATIKGATGNYLKVLIAIGVIAVLTQSIFHIVLATDNGSFREHFTHCSENDKIARQIAVERLDTVPAVDVVRLILPDVLVFIVPLVVYVVCFFLLKREAAQEPSELPVATVKTRRRRRVNSIIQFFGEFLLIALVGLSGIILPSIINAVYFLTFLIVGTLWACYQGLGQKFSRFRVFLLVYTGLHILVLHLYQFQFFQDYVEPSSFIARLLGLTGIVKTNCDHVWMIEFHDSIKWPYCVNPGILLILYWVLAFETRHWVHGKDLVEDEVGSPSRGKKRKKVRQGSERQVLPQGDHEETGSVVFSGSAYGEPDNLDEQLLVDEGENAGYSSMEPVNAERGTLPSSSKPRGASVDADHETDGSSRRDASQKRSPLVSVFVYIMKQSYVLTLIAMMAWSITFHSWLTFVLLLSACILWMIPKSRRAVLVMSPVIVFYAECLLLIQFIFGMNLKELPNQAGDFSYHEIGLQTFEFPCLQLGVQVFYTLFFWLTLRQYMRERRTQKDQNPGYPMEPVDGSTTAGKSTFTDFLDLPVETDMIDGYDSNAMKMAGRFLWLMLCKYWIFVCAGMLLLIAIQDVVVYRIIYMILFLLFVLTFQLSYVLWRVMMFIFWWVVIVYSMVVLIVIYTYQFDKFPEYWRNNTGLSNDTLTDIGLEQYDTAGLFIKLLTPTSFLIVVILQVHYFHTPFLRISALDRYRREDTTDSPPADYTTDETGGTTTDTDGETNLRKKRLKRLQLLFFKVWAKGSELWGKVTEFLWRLAEIHIFKVVAFVIMVVCAKEVSAMSAVYIIMMIILLPMSLCQLVLSHFAQVWTALVLLAKMMYQLKLVKTDYWHSDCPLTSGLANTPAPSVNMSGANSTPTVNPMDFGNSSNPPILINNTIIDNALWVGLAKLDSLHVDIAYYLRNFILILIVIAFERIVRLHQIQHFNRLNIDRPRAGIIFPDTQREDADTDIKSCLKFFGNYMFYKFGLEICYIMTAITICVRVDAYAVVYAVFLGILLLMSRRNNARFWPIYTIILAVLLPLQYLSCLGFPYALCIEYPWDNNSQMSMNLEMWLFLPDYANPPPATKLIADFFQLLFVCLQWRVFSIELSSKMEEYGGGDNQDILPQVEANTEIPVADFTTTTTSYLDVIKYAVFEYMFWVTLAIVFITGTSRINLFSMGYVIGVFYFMWYGQEFLLNPLRKLLRMWNVLLMYTFFVLFAKACLQLVGCVYITRLYKNECWLIQLLGINCLSSTIDRPSSQDNCSIEEDDTGLSWDVICFVFLLLQRRIYSSQYFRHVVDELEAQNRLSSRGAELINRIMIREVNRQNEQEKEILLNIKKKMKAIKEKQTKVKKDFVEPEDHYQAIRSGDYYMFEDESDEEGAPDQADTLSFGKEIDVEKDKDKMGPLQIITTAMDSGTDVAVAKAASKESLKEDGPSKEGDGTAPGSPKAGTSTGATPSGGQPEEEGAPEKAYGKAKQLGIFILTFLKSIVDWFIRLFNKISRNYRIVAHKLEKEMKHEKQKIQNEKSYTSIAEKKGDKSLDEEDGAGEKADAGASDSDLVEVTVGPVEPRTLSTSGSALSLTELEEREEAEEEFEKSQPRLYRLLVATYYMLVSRSELLCYFLMILNQIIYASLLSLALPLMVFLWGMLSVPRPSKKFWITVITYVEAIVVVKYLFQFSFFPWNDGSIRESPFWPPRIIGVEKQDNYASADLALLLALFIHRSILKRYGLWKDTEDISADLARAGEKELSPPCSPQPDGEDADILPALEEGKKAADSSDTGSQLVLSGSSIEESGEEKKKPSKVKEGLKKCVRPFKNFFNQVTGSTYNATVDVYAPMFCCDFIAFLIVVFGYWAFGPQTSGGDVTSVIQENRVPVPFLVMLIAQFVLIIIDRALFLRKNVLGKFIFQIVLVFLVHLWMFFILPAVTDRPFYKNIPAILWYFVKCIYFGLSAYQIRCGYPTRILGNFLTKKYNYLNLILFKGFLAIPFLLELRALMDWIWTDTTLALGSWLQMEDIYANIFVLKCFRRAEATYPTPRAMKRKAVIKYGVGGLLLFVIIFIIWFPLVIFSLANAVFEKNPPYESTATITIGGYQPIFKMTAQQQNIVPLTGSQYSSLKSRYNKDRSAVGFISNYDAEDVTMITLNGKSTSVWGISPPSQQDLIKDLNKDHPMKMEFLINFVREPTTGQSESISNEFVITLKDEEKRLLAHLINDTSTAGRGRSVTIAELFPRFIRLGLSGRAQAVTPLISGEFGIENSNITVSLARENSSDQSPVEWWQVQEIVHGSVFDFDPKKKNLVDNLTVITFNDRKAPAGFSFITGYGIIGLYVSFILLIGRILRLSTTGMYTTIMFMHYPYVDRVLTLCLNIYLVREMKEFVLEEDLFAKLLFFYRSPETMIKWTRRPKKKDD